MPAQDLYARLKEKTKEKQLQDKGYQGELEVVIELEGNDVYIRVE
jgi:hypothetical protein